MLINYCFLWNLMPKKRSRKLLFKRMAELKMLTSNFRLCNDEIARVNWQLEKWMRSQKFSNECEQMSSFNALTTCLFTIVQEWKSYFKKDRKMYFITFEHKHGFFRNKSDRFLDKGWQIVLMTYSKYLKWAFCP